MRKLGKSSPEKKKQGTKISRTINKIMVIIGLTLLVKGLKGWINSKKKEIIH